MLENRLATITKEWENFDYHYSTKTIEMYFMFFQLRVEGTFYFLEFV